MERREDGKNYVPDENGDCLDLVEFFGGFPAIQEKIFNDLTVPQLLRCTQVSKSWHATSSRILSEHKCCFAYISSKSSCISQLLQLNNLILKMEIVPFNGLHITNMSRDHHPCLFELPEDILDSPCFRWLFQVPWKYLSIRLPDCCGNSLMGRILWEARHSVQELTIDCEAEEKIRFFQSEMKGHQGSLFPKLHKLTLPDEKEFAHLLALYLVNVAPNLREIRGQLRLSGLRYFTESQYETLKDVSILVNLHMNRSLVIRPAAFSVIPVETLVKFANNPKLSVESLTILSSDPIAPNALTPLSQILQNCRRTLRFLSIRCNELVRIVEKDMLILPTLKVLHLPALPEGHQSGRVVKSLLRKLNIPLCFPNLKTLHTKFHWSTWVNTDFDFHEDEPISSHLVPEIVVEGDRWPYETIIPFFVNAFPLLKSFQFSIPNERNFDGIYNSFSQIWDELPSLEDLRIFGMPDELSLDALLCGISPSEVQRLLESHRRGALELEELQLVPLRPPLTNAEGLKSLGISLSCASGSGNGKDFCISEVFGYLIARRIPNLQVHIEGPMRSARDLCYLLPFAELSYK